MSDLTDRLNRPCGSDTGGCRECSDQRTEAAARIKELEAELAEDHRTFQKRLVERIARDLAKRREPRPSRYDFPPRYTQITSWEPEP